MELLRIEPSGELRKVIRDGFGEKKSGEDPFDSFIGALGVINVLNGNRPEKPPGPPDPWEGWVLGQTDPPKSKESCRIILRASLRGAQRRSNPSFSWPIG
jgi:hypothetical protein